MRFAVGDVQQAGTIDKESMRPRQLALQRIGFGTVATLAAAEHGRDDAAPEVDAANDMVLGVGNKQSAPRRIERQPFRSAKFGGTSRTAVTGVTLLAASRHVVNG